MTKNLDLRCVWDKSKGTADIVDTTNGQTKIHIMELVQDNKTLMGMLTGAKPGDYIGVAVDAEGKKHEAGIYPKSADEIVCRVPEKDITAFGPRP